MSVALIITFLIVGIILILLEIFFLPGFTIAGIAGGLFFAAAIWISFSTFGSEIGLYSLFGAIATLFLSIFIFVKIGVLDKISLKAKIDSKVETRVDRVKIGDTGTTLSRLAPIGNAEFENETIEVKSIDGFVDAGQKIEVIDLDNQIILVKRIENK